ERVDLITVTALTQHDRFFQPWSWQVNVGARRQETADLNTARPMVAFFDISGGINRAITENISIYTLVGGATEAGHSMPHGFDVAPLLELGMAGHYASGISPVSGQWQVTAKQLEWCKLSHDQQKMFSLRNSFNLDRNLSLQLNFSKNKRFSRWSTENSIGVAAFF
ncbi:MAG TPA: hypothetical protein VFM46_15240, partial [Pseudomonadales bacterium]|nr:hypothetical protein [Pseudomonadales bacterium]